MRIDFWIVLQLLLLCLALGVATALVLETALVFMYVYANSLGFREGYGILYSAMKTGTSVLGARHTDSGTALLVAGCAAAILLLRRIASLQWKDLVAKALEAKYRTGLVSCRHWL